MLAPNREPWRRPMMLRNTLMLLAAGLACAAAAPAAKPTPGPKPAAKSAARPGARVAAFDARDPASLIAVLPTLGAKAEVARKEGDAVFLTVTSPTEAFSAQFAGCDAQGRGCQAVLFDRVGGSGAPTVAQLNAFNQTSVMCRLYQDKGGRPHVEYSTLLFPSSTRQDVLTHLNAWRGCIAEFNDFLRDPNAFLAGAA